MLYSCAYSLNFLFQSLSLKTGVQPVFRSTGQQKVICKTSQIHDMHPFSAHQTCEEPISLYEYTYKFLRIHTRYCNNWLCKCGIKPRKINAHYSHYTECL